MGNLKMRLPIFVNIFSEQHARLIKIQLTQLIKRRYHTMYDCGFRKDNNWFRYRAGAIIVENGCVLYAGNENEDYYYSIGGGEFTWGKQQKLLYSERSLKRQV